MARDLFPTFAGGELGPELQSRSDTGKYKTALRKARNVYVRTQGGVANRPGMRHVGEAYDTTKLVRLIPFQFSTEQQYQLEFSDLLMRVIYKGGYVLRPELEVSGITNAAQAEAHVVAHGYAVGDEVYFSGIEGMTEINGMVGRVTAVGDADHFTVDIDSTGFGAYTGSTGGVAGDVNGGEEGEAPSGPDQTVTPPFVDIEIPPPTFEFILAPGFNLP